MANVNISKVYLLRVPLESDLKNTLYFTSKDEQRDYFLSKKVSEFDNDNFSYQRKDSVIRLNKHIDKILTCNYVMYQNTYYSNKWFYCFIKDMRYINDGTTEVEIETDVIQTWLFDYTLKQSFVEREHVNDDTIGLHIIDEGLETGEYMCNEHYVDTHFNEIINDFCYILATTKDLETDPDDDKKLMNATGGVYNGVYSPSSYYRFDSAFEAKLAIATLDGFGAGDAVTGFFMLPKILAPFMPVDHNNPDSGYTEKVDTSTLPITYESNLSKNYGLNGYSPRNNKLKTFPYTYLMVSNNQGGEVVYHYEDFSESTCDFITKCALAPGGSIRMTPQNFKGVAQNDSESINLGKFPICAWSNDMYTNWLTQNSLNIGLSVASAGISVLGGLGMMATGGGALAGASSVVSGAMGIAQTLGQIHQQSLVPPQASGNTNSGDVVTSSGTNTFHFYHMSIKKQFAEILDKYFDMFGYKVNMVKVPNKAHRSRWWYTKTIDVNIDGNIPNNDMQKIKDCYNSGITFWRNGNEIQDYSLSNGIV